MITFKQYGRSAARVILYAFAYVLLEWLFLVTKPSFLGGWPFSRQVDALLIGAIPFLVAALALHAVFCFAAFAATRLNAAHRIAALLLKIVPALIATAIVLMLIDNFTYSVFGWGIVSTNVYTAPVYWVLCLLVFAVHIRRHPVGLPFKVSLAAGLVLACAAALGWSLYKAGSFIDHDYHSGWAGARLPNIIMFASDGVTADHMSVYGYTRKTTPHLDAYSDRALIANNAFTNSGWTTGSLTSMMTGKYPATTKVLYPPYTLQGTDAYQNLPRILRKLGYTNLQETVRYYADGPDLNWAESFDFANGRKVEQSSFGAGSLALQDPLMLTSRLRNRLGGRIKQLLFIKRMINSYALVTSDEADIAKVQGISDETRMTRVFDFIQHAHQPFFIHIHLLGTHCCGFHPKHRVFNEADPHSAVFDDTVLESDEYFGRMMALLKQRHLLKNTLVVYTSDHDKGWDFRGQVPMIFIFPGGAHHGHIETTTQLLDVAPTILDYLKVPVPSWMEGQSLLHGKLDPYRPVYAIYRLHRKHFTTDKGDELGRVTDMGPPTYGLRTMGMVVCHRWYLMNINTGGIASGNVGDYENEWRAAPEAPIGRSDCKKDELPDAKEARAMMSRFLHKRGFIF